MLFRACDGPHKILGGPLSPGMGSLRYAMTRLVWAIRPVMSPCVPKADVGQMFPRVGALWAKKCPLSPGRALSGLRCINKRKIYYSSLRWAPLRSGVGLLSPGMDSLRRIMGKALIGLTGSQALDWAMRLVVSSCGALFAEGPEGCSP